MTEKDVERKLILHASEIGSTLFKNNVGMYRDERGNVIRFGLCKGSSDLIGWTPVTITQAMVGKRLAVFTAVEVKKNKHGSYRATEDQLRFISAVNRNGGIGLVADCNEDLDAAVNTLADIPQDI